MNIYEKEKIELIFADFKNNVLPQIKTAIEGREKKTVVSAINTRLQAVEALIGNASSSDDDNVINKVVEMIDFFSGITEEKTVAGLLASLKAELEAEIEHISYNSQTGKIQKTVNGQTSDLVTIVSSGFSMSEDDTEGVDTLTAIGGASITEDDVNGIDEFDF